MVGSDITNINYDFFFLKPFWLKVLCPSTHLSTAFLPHPKKRGGKEEKRNLGHVIIWRALGALPALLHHEIAAPPFLAAVGELSWGESSQLLSTGCAQLPAVYLCSYWRASTLKGHYFICRLLRSNPLRLFVFWALDQRLGLHARCPVLPLVCGGSSVTSQIRFPEDHTNVFRNCFCK